MVLRNPHERMERGARHEYPGLLEAIPGARTLSALYPWSTVHRLDEYLFNRKWNSYVHI